MKSDKTKWCHHPRAGPREDQKMPAFQRFSCAFQSTRGLRKRQCAGSLCTALNVMRCTRAHHATRKTETRNSAVLHRLRSCGKLLRAPLHRASVLAHRLPRAHAKQEHRGDDPRRSNLFYREWGVGPRNPCCLSCPRSQWYANSAATKFIDDAKAQKHQTPEMNR